MDITKNAGFVQAPHRKEVIFNPAAQHAGVSTRNFGLDVLRSSAILCVVFFHINISLLSGNIVNSRLYIPNGVDMFFVLSGFLIGGMLIKTIQEKDHSRKELYKFWWMRWFRTLPNYFFFTIIVFILFNHGHIKWLNLFFLQNFYKTQNTVYFETWSLSVEEWFYFLFPLLLFTIQYFTGNARKSILMTIILFCVAGFCFKYYYIVYHLRIDFAHMKMEFRKFFEIKTLVINRMDSICIGVLGAYMSYYFSAILKAKKNVLFLAGLCIFIFCTVVDTNLLEYQLITTNAVFWSLFSVINSVGILFMIPAIVELNINNKYISNFFTLTSKISYTMYLMHMLLLKIVIVVCMAMNVQRNTLTYISILACYFILLYMLSTLNYKFLEKRFMNYRAQFIAKHFK